MPATVGVRYGHRLAPSEALTTYIPVTFTPTAALTASDAARIAAPVRSPEPRCGCPS
ncbi:hypothetical protein ABH926_006059 [Catenulispora sp. GP43]|uniref:hypothetical protein n=1 Tax=Catenulispora sp. GP43 TaxID=3156263 RepID=UPI003516E765